ncbi:MAG: type II toxin-antitoxin system HicA family toxin [Desulfotomaculaceae bacterium]|nr:type II toxin-antitoxin system HicA family toxin [Desulfotomaculaceae bacterium]
MTPRQPRISGKEIVGALNRGGFAFLYIEDSHHYFISPTGNLVTVPVHGKKILKPKTLKSILEQAGITIEQLINLL